MPAALPSIVVTAEKAPRLESETPVAMTVITGEEAENAGGSDLKTLSAIEPGLGFAQVGMVGPVLTIRGISSRDVTEIGDPAVPVAVDGTYVNRPYGLFNALYDLQQIDLLRGPQGTLYGRNAIGGLINIVTAKPTKELEGSASVGLGNYATRNLAATVNVPVSDDMQFRVAAISRRHDGYLNNSPSPNGNDENTRSGRFTLAVEPNRDLRALFSVETTSIKGTGPVSLDIPFVYNADGSASHGMPAFPADPRTFKVTTPASLDISDTAGRWSVIYDLPAIELTYVGGYDVLVYHHAGDSSPSGAAPVSYGQNEYPTTQNHELRVASRGDGRWSWQAGVSYFRENSRLNSANESPFAGGQYLPTLAFAYGIRTASTALFGQTSYRLTPRVKLTVGARVTRDAKARDGEYYYATNDTAPLEYVHVPQDDSHAWHKATWHLGLDWAVSAQTLAYAKFDTGYKAGGFTSSGPYGPETLKGFEIGTKSRLFDDRVQINVSAFGYDDAGQQVQQLVAFANGRTGTRIVNAGRTSIVGAEAALSGIVEPVGRIDLAVNVLRARFRDFVVDNGSGQNVQLAGNAPPQSPALSVRLAVEHRIRIAWGQLVGRADLNFQSGQHMTFYNYPDDYQRAHVTANLSATFIPSKGNVELQIYARNITNTRVLVAGEEYRFDNAYRYAFAAPRTFGVVGKVYW